jgi:hypothetical protein
VDVFRFVGGSAIYVFAGAAITHRAGFGGAREEREKKAMAIIDDYLNLRDENPAVDAVRAHIKAALAEGVAK